MHHRFCLSTAALLLGTQLSGTAARGAERTIELPGMVVTAERTAVEKGTNSIFRALPPRDLLERPLTESPGLETAISVIGAEEIRWRNTPLLLDAMQYVPGAWTETRGRKEKQLFSVRGAAVSVSRLPD